MYKTIITTAVVTAVSVAAALHYRSMSDAVVARFPEIDSKIARKAYRRMLIKAYSGEYNDIDTASDDAMDVLFNVEVFRILSEK
jgi:hypothetical protein